MCLVWLTHSASPVKYFCLYPLQHPCTACHSSKSMLSQSWPQDYHCIGSEFSNYSRCFTVSSVLSWQLSTQRLHRCLGDSQPDAKVCPVRACMRSHWNSMITMLGLRAPKTNFCSGTLQCFCEDVKTQASTSPQKWQVNFTLPVLRFGGIGYPSVPHDTWQIYDIHYHDTWQIHDIHYHEVLLHTAQAINTQLTSHTKTATRSHNASSHDES